MDGTLSLELISAVEHEYDLHVALLARLRSDGADCSPDCPKPTSARFWGKLLPEYVADLWEDMKVAERRRRDVLRRISNDTGVWRLSLVLERMPRDDSAHLAELKRKFASVASEIAAEVRMRPAA